MEKEMFFFIADISGYTSYMLVNQLDCDHAKFTLSVIIERLIKKIQFPLEVTKLEGDAVFLYLEKKIDDPLWLCNKIFTFFQVFEKTIQELQLSSTCRCGGCTNIDKLDLKIIVHYGLASIQKIGRFRELSGVDVIILHRLLKNSIPNKRYLLLTEAAYQHMLIPPNVNIAKSQESYADIGTIVTYVCEPPPINIDDLPNYASFFYKLKRWLSVKIGGSFMKLGFKKLGPFRHLP